MIGFKTHSLRVWGSTFGKVGQVSLAILIGSIVINVPFLACDTFQVDELLGT